MQILWESLQLNEKQDQINQDYTEPLSGASCVGIHIRVEYLKESGVNI